MAKQNTTQKADTKTETVGEVKEHLTGEEKVKLTSCENLIKSHNGSFYQAGKALRTIQNEKLFKNYSTFEKYCIHWRI